MRKCLLAFFIICLTVVSAFSQSVMDPDDSVYSDIRVWQTQGVLGLLPQLRPYPVQVVRDILNKVMSEGNEQQVKRAKYQYDRIFGKRPVSVGIKTEAVVNASTASVLDKQAVAGLFAEGQVEPLDLTSIVFDVDILATNKESSTLISPTYSASKYDVIDDPMKITSSLRGYFLGNADIAYGTQDAYIMAGLNRSSWGDFYDNSIVLSPEAFHAGNVTASVNREKWNYSLSMFSLAASEDDGTGWYSQKYLVLHSVSFEPVKKLDVTFFETMVYGKRFEPLYLLPVVPMMISQGMTGFSDDNLQMGVSFKYRPANGINWNTTAMLDDINLNELVKLDLNTQIKMAAQTGLVWTPDSDLVSAVALDYTIVMPYMYTHSSDSEDATSSGDNINYQNYTNKGINLGSQLQPNSDCINIKATLRPLPDVQFVFGAAFIRHANVNESLPDEIAEKYLDYPAVSNNTTSSSTDGSVYDYADSDTGAFDWAKSNFLFLSQDTKEYTIKASVDATWDLPQEAWGRISLNAGYVFEYIINYGVGNSIYSSGSYAATAEGVAAAKAAWKSKLTNVLNNYFTLGVKYSW